MQVPRALLRLNVTVLTVAVVVNGPVEVVEIGQLASPALRVKVVSGGSPDMVKLELNLPWPATGGTVGVSRRVLGLIVMPAPAPGEDEPPGADPPVATHEPSISTVPGPQVTVGVVPPPPPVP